MGEQHVLGGQAFTVIGESTIEHDYTFFGICQAAGISSPKLEPGETPGDFAVRLLGDILGSGRALDLLGCILIPEGTSSEEWTKELCQETASFLGGLTSAADKKAINNLTLSALIDFFESGLASSIASLRSSMSESDPIKVMTKLTGMEPGATLSGS